jgi:predicted nucleic acid-binding protein
LRAFVDTNVLIRYLVNEPVEQSGRVQALLESDVELILTDLIVAEVAYVLTLVYARPRADVATALRSLITFPRMAITEPSRLLRSVDLYEELRLDFADAYLLACAEDDQGHTVVSFDRGLGRLAGVTGLEP